MYLLTDALRIKNQQVCRQSILISEGKVTYIRDRMPYWRKWRVNVSNLVLAPGKIGTDHRILQETNLRKRQLIEEEWLKQGVTTLSVFIEVKSERSLPVVYEAACSMMKQSSLDYILGITIPIRLLNPSLLRTCKRLHIPLIQVVIETDEQLDRLPWSRFADACVTYPVVLIPTLPTNTNYKDGLVLTWKNRCSSFGLSTASLPRIWTKELLQKSGIYPLKGELLVGSDADYLLYHQHTHHYMSRQARMVAANADLDYDRDEPAVVIQRGHILKVNDECMLNERGEQILVKKPKRLCSLDYASSCPDQRLGLLNTFIGV
ncbi:hypothetical protein [Alkalicoccobacillus murimartini]|uniref:Amidohydrolase-related domain-containing protein n=1 Tax=Alkalicoccobacillus murimartini TaxID=171685 RepID=A0ABT9YDK1_9BACI|nr:hypothetical protein [Alkalicoccobacillus murimartini]MDQ0205930.1 hypothetical protein [Alkalicoccobacillus murimartini]